MSWGILQETGGGSLRAISDISLSHFVSQVVLFKPMRCRFSAGLHQAEDPAYHLTVTELLREVKRAQQIVIETNFTNLAPESAFPSLTINLEERRRIIALDNIGNMEADINIHYGVPK